MTAPTPEPSTPPRAPDVESWRGTKPATDGLRAAIDRLQERIVDLTEDRADRDRQIARLESAIRGAGAMTEKLRAERDKALAEVADHEAVYGQMLDNVGKARRERDEAIVAHPAPPDEAKP